MRRFKKRIRKLKSRCYIDVGDYRKSVFLAGTGRSGTTWVEEIINYQNDYRVMFEPFHSLNVDILKNWNYKQYLRIDNTSEDYLEPAAAILSGQIRDAWIDKFNRKHLVNKRLIKDIRANLLLRWIKRHFPEIPIILLLRHPCAVANSRVRLKWNCHLDDLLSQEDLIADYLRPFKCHMESATDAFDKHVYMWCVENFIPLTQFSAGEILVVFYEDLCKNPRDEFQKITSFLGEQLPISARQSGTIPSALSRDDSAVRLGKEPIEAWRTQVSDRQIEKTGEICRLFGMDTIYGEGSMPLLNGEAALNVFPAGVGSAALECQVPGAA